MNFRYLFILFFLCSANSALLFAAETPPGGWPKDKEELYPDREDQLSDLIDDDVYQPINDASAEPQNKKPRHDESAGEDSSGSDNSSEESKTQKLKQTVRRLIDNNQLAELETIIFDEETMPNWVIGFMKLIDWDDIADRWRGGPQEQYEALALICASLANGHYDLAESLVNANVNLDLTFCFLGRREEQHRNGWIGWDLSHGYKTALCAAIFEEDEDAIKFLLESRADVNAGDNTCPLHEATIMNDNWLVMDLLDHNANIDLDCDLWGSPLHATFGFMGDCPDAREELLYNCADITSRSCGVTPLHLAAYCLPTERHDFEPRHADAFGLCLSMIESFKRDGFPEDQATAARARIHTAVLCIRKVTTMFPSDVVRMIVLNLEEDIAKVWITSLANGRITGIPAFTNRFCEISAMYLVNTLSPLFNEIDTQIRQQLQDEDAQEDDEVDQQVTVRRNELAWLFSPINRIPIFYRLFYLKLNTRLQAIEKGELFRNIIQQEIDKPSAGELFRNILRDQPGISPEAAWEQVRQILERGDRRVEVLPEEAPAEANGPVPMDINNDNNAPYVDNPYVDNPNLDNNVNGTAAEEGPQFLPRGFFGFGS